MGLFSKKKDLDDKRIFCSAVVPAAGLASRMGGAGKMLADIGGVPVLALTLAALDACADIDEIVVAARSEDIVPIADMCKRFGISKVSHIVRGGETRAHSVMAALLMCAPGCGVVAIHDGARPCVTPELCSRAINEAARCGAAAPGVPVADTLKAVENGVISRTVDRADLVTIQTPQCFEPNLIKGAIQKALTDAAAITDDCSAVERIGMKVRVVEGDPENIKITTPGDLAVAEGILARRERQSV